MPLVDMLPRGHAEKSALLWIRSITDQARFIRSTSATYGRREWIAFIDELYKFSQQLPSGDYPPLERQVVDMLHCLDPSLNYDDSL